MVVQWEVAAFAAVNVAAIVGAHVSLRQKLEDLQKRTEERLDRIEARIGLNGESEVAFVRRGECSATMGRLESLVETSHCILTKLEERMSRSERRHDAAKERRL